MSDYTRDAITGGTVKVPIVRLDQTHTGDGTEQTWRLDTSGVDSVMLAILPDGSLTTGSYSVEEAPYFDAGASYQEEVTSGSLTASTLSTERITVYGSSVEIKITADSSVTVKAVAN